MPSTKVLTHFLVGALLAVAGYLAKDTSWVGWIPTSFTWAVPVLLQAVAAGAAYLKNETNPAPSSLVANR